MSALGRHLRFEPHGTRLLTSSAAFWLFSARVLVFAMAGAESMAWAYLGFLFGEGPARWAGAFFTGTVIFLVVWMIDVSLITLDRAFQEHSIAILGPDTKPVQASPQSGNARSIRDWFTFGLRIALLVGSLTITAPYLAQLVFHRDIQDFVAAEATKALEDGRNRLSAKYETSIAEKNRQLEQARSTYQHEVAGKGLSGRYGMGAAAKALLAEIPRREAERDVFIRQKEEALARFDQLAGSWSENQERLASDYNVVIPRTSILENRKALEELRKRPENRSTELAIKAFLSFIFSGLLLLKLFEPSSVRLYLSEVLQQEYERYLAGTFDWMIPATERSTASRSAMSPQRFYDFLVRVWVPARRMEREQAEANARTLVSEQSVESLERIRLQVSEELEIAKQKEQAVRTLAEDASRSLTELNSAIANIQADVTYFQSRIGKVESPKATLDDESRLEYEESRLSIQFSLKQKSAEANRALRQLLDELPTESDKARRANAELQKCEDRVRAKEVELAEIHRRIGEIRKLVSDAADNRVRSVFGADAN